jgi:hypothetical protein
MVTPADQWTSAANKPWKKLEIIVPDLSPLQKLIEFIDKVKEVLRVIVGIIDLIAKLIMGLQDALATAIKLIIDKIKQILEGFLGDVGIYMLFVPIAKRFNTTFMGLGDLTPPRTSALFAPSPTNLQSPNQKQFIAELNKYAGGNHGFYRTVATSLQDPGDTNRPQFNDSTDFVGGLTILFGTDLDPFELLDALWRLWGMFGGLTAGSDNLKVPKPKNVQAQALTKPKGGDVHGVLTALVTWDAEEVPVFTLPDMGSAVLYPERYAVIVIKNDCQLASSGNVNQIFGTTDISINSFRKTPMGYASVLVEEPYSITKTSALIRGLSCTDDDSLHFCVAWKLNAYHKDANILTDAGTPLGYWYISNMARVVPFPLAPGSTTPDWVRTPSIADCFPQLAYFFRLIIGYLEAFAKRIMGVSDFLKNYLELLNNEVQRYEDLIQGMLDQIKAIIEMLKIPKVAGGIYTRVFFGQGGNEFFLSDLATSLSNGYPNAPPFHRGDEYVTGAVLLAGGPEVDVRKTMGLIALLFGQQFEGKQEELNNLLSGLGEATKEAEKVTFTDEMSEETATPESAVDTAPFTEALEPTIKLCKVPDPILTAFDNSFLPIVV